MLEWVPDAGDIVWLTFDPQVGREQAGRRPALVLSPALYNRRSGLAIMCPITSRRKGYPFEVEVPQGLEVAGAILADHVKSLDWRAERAGNVPASTLREVQARLAPLLGL
jgi:mRNA interferase MazF